MQSYGFLMNRNDCHSFHDYNKHRQSHGSFADFCRDASECVGSILIAELSDEESQTDDEDEVDHAAAAKDKRAFVYNKREKYFNVAGLIAKRRDGSLPHREHSIGVQRTCVWCCNTKEHVAGAKHTRQGMKTSICCSVCEVSLCNVKRFGGETCFEQWHKATRLNNPCRVDGPVLAVQNQPNRPAPPSRKRDDNEDPNPRSKGQRLIAPEPRQLRSRR
jgi:hypothetical protein